MGNQIPHVSCISNLPIQPREEQIRVCVWECLRSGNKHWFPKPLQESRLGLKVYLKHHQPWLCRPMWASPSHQEIWALQHSQWQTYREATHGLGMQPVLLGWCSTTAPTASQASSWCFSYVREQQLPRELGEGALLTIIDHVFSSKCQLKQCFSDRGKTSDILSPWITSKKRNFGVQTSCKLNQWRIVRKKPVQRDFLAEEWYARQK